MLILVDRIGEDDILRMHVVIWSLIPCQPILKRLSTGFGVRDKAVSSLVERRESPIPPVRIAPHDDITPKTHGLVEDSKTVAPRMDGFL